jgi:SAM-dependent methyltransferase
MLDYGGADGSHIPEQFNNVKKFVYDISDVPLIDGVERFDFTEDKLFDLITCSHILEHVSTPTKIVADIKRIANANSFFYFEVPGYSAPPPANIVFHEHINIYNLNVITTLLNRNGINVIDHHCNEKYVCILGKLK